MPCIRSAFVNWLYSLANCGHNHAVHPAAIEKIHLASQVLIIDGVRGGVRRRHNDEHAPHGFVGFAAPTGVGQPGDTQPGEQLTRLYNSLIDYLRWNSLPHGASDAKAIH